MSNFAKKIRKVTKKPKNLVCIDVDNEMVDELCNEFQNVFWHSESMPSKKSKNLIFLEEIDKKFLLPDISVVLSGENGINKISSINYVLESQNADMVLQIGEHVSKKTSRYFQSINYNMVILEKRWQLWRKKGKL